MREVTSEAPRLRWDWRAEAVLLAVVGTVQLLGTSLAARHQSGVRSLDVLGYLLLIAALAALPLRRRWPVPALAAAFVLTLGYALLNYPGGPVWAPLIITFGTVLVAGRRVVAYLCLAAGYGAFLWLVKAVTGRSYPSAGEAIGLAAWLLLLAALAELIRNRRAYQQASRQRHLEAQRSREEQVRRQASEVRLGVARELHDVLAHSISLINVQAGVALELMEQRPEQARSALAAIKQASKDALVEVQAMLGTLRADGEHVPRSPAPRLADLAGLVRRADAAGLTVQMHVTGEPVPLPAGVDLAAYRIVQEALTNVVRHAGARIATVRLDYRPGELCVQVDDDGHRSPDGPGKPTEMAGGSGIAGMRERASALGGDLTTSPRPGGGFRVRARLPMDGTA